MNLRIVIVLKLNFLQCPRIIVEDKLITQITHFKFKNKYTSYLTKMGPFIKKRK